jgi:uncharacterized membrane protein YphA (DoxX/SURF4 family)
MAASTESKPVRILALVLRLVLGGIFVYAAWIKLRDPWQLFAMAIDSYGILPLKYVELTAKVLPWIELGLGLWLIVGKWQRIPSVAVSLLLTLFFTLIVRAYIRGEEINCGCFGPGEAISWKTLLRDGSMLAGSFILTWLSFRRARPQSPVLEPTPELQKASS